MNQSLLERERIHERFQRRTRRARTARSVDLTVNFGLVEIRRTDLGEHVHCPGINQKYCGVFDAAIAIIRDVIGYSSLNGLLLFQIECGDYLIATMRRLEQLLNKMWREEFSLRLHSRAEFTHRKLKERRLPSRHVPRPRKLSGSFLVPVIPTGLRKIHRMIIAIGV